ncbi:MAG TPA: NAD(+)/NADH kinase [Actinobacteria bacterium]|nr:NAD(+)/NADH kinase [Actinomycetota bacterium]
MKKISIIAHTKKPRVKEVALKIISWLEKQNIGVQVAENDALALGRADLGVRDNFLLEGVNLLISLGGDGTILRAVKLLKGKDVPILGVNLGRFGFLAEVDVEDVENVLPQIIEGNYQLDKRMLLRCEMIRDNKVVFKQDVLNEAVMGRGIQQRLTEFEIEINGKFFARYSADSVIFATPTGSTAYSLSAGGPLIVSKMRAIIMMPVCPHSFFDRSIVLSESDEINVRCLESSSEIALSFDGITLQESNRFDFLKIYASPKEVTLIRFGERDFYAVLKEKLEAWTRIGG